MSEARRRRAAALLAFGALATTHAMADQIFEYRSIHDVESLFATYHYTPKDWHAGAFEVPRIYLDDVPSSWRETHARRIPTAEKKTLFFRFLAPIALYVNELILEDRERAERLLDRQSGGLPLAAEDQRWLRELAVDYGVPDADSEPIDRALGAELLRRVDAIPPSLVLAQGAIESGWGTSRFADVGNSLFGQWCRTGGIKPAEQRTETHGDHRIAAFETTTLSAASYARNLNTHAAYESFRREREALRTQESHAHGRDLAATMIRYSERGEAYVHELRVIMRQNKLDALDEAMLRMMEVIRLEPSD